MADADALTEKIRQALSDGEALQCTRVWEAWQHGTMSDEDFTDASDGPLPGEVAAAVLPIVAVEVRKAKAEAWDEGYLDRSPYGGRAQSRADNPYRETGDSDEHR